MKSVKNIQKITKAMKMVAASKLRAVQTRAENSRGLWQPFTALLGDATSMLFYTLFYLINIHFILFTFLIFMICMLVQLRLKKFRRNQSHCVQS
jgi:hypothetical protein